MILPLFLAYFIEFCCAFSPSGNPLYKKQYYIRNNGSIFNSLRGEDLNVVPAWKKGYTGDGIHIIVVNDGCQANHSEIEENFNMNMSFNYETNTNDPSYDPRQFITSTGTKLATIAAGVDNTICGIGIAYNSVISCVNVLSSEKAFKNYEIGIKLNGDVSGSIRIFPSFSYSNSKFCYLREISKNEDVFFKTLEAIFVTNAIGDITLNEDINYQQYPANPYILTFAEISQRGGRTLSSPRSNCIIASVVTGGSDYESPTSFLSAYISTGDGFGDTCSETVLPAGTGGAMAAGVISLILSAAPEPLMENDIAVIIALTSAKNDPYSKSWKKNKRGIRYSPIYGFGRLDAEAAVNMASNYSHKNRSKTEIVSISPRSLKIPSFLSGFFDVKLELFESKIKFIEFIQLLITFTNDPNLTDYSLFRIIIVSPSGTERMIKDIAPVIEPKMRSYRFTVRDFFGETANGTWTVRFLRENVGKTDYTPTLVEIDVNGYEEDNFDVQSDKLGANPFQSYANRVGKLQLELPEGCNKDRKSGKKKKFDANFDADEDNDNFDFKFDVDKKHNFDVDAGDNASFIKCGSEFNFTIVVGGDDSKNLSQVPFDLVLVPSTEDGGQFEPFGSAKVNMKSSATIDCGIKGGRYRLRAVNPVYAASTSDEVIELLNGDDYSYSKIGFDASDQYRTIEMAENNDTVISIDLNRNNRQTLSSYKLRDSVLATLWNTETDDIYGTQKTTARGGFYVYKEKVECKKCILTVVPIEIEDESPISQCNTFVNALSIVKTVNDTLTNFEKFPIQWNGFCPVPDGIIVQTPTPTPQPFFSPSPTFTPIVTFPPPSRTPHNSLPTKTIVAIVVSTCIVVGVIIFLIFWRLKKKIGANSQTTEQMLKTTPLLPSSN